MKPLLSKLLLPKLLLLIAMTLVVAGAARAQTLPPPPPHVESLDLPAVNASVVITGTAVSYKAASPAEKGWTVTLAVKETLKGEAKALVTARLLRPETDLARWKTDSALLLVAIPGARGLSAPDSIALDAPAMVIDLSAKDLAVFTADLKLLRRPEEVVRAMKERIRITRGVAKVDRFARTTPIERIENTSESNPRMRWHRNMFVDVPVDDRLERFGQRAIRTKQPEQRIEGIQVLRHFGSAQNLGLIRTMLRDETGWALGDLTEGNKRLRFRTNGVRRQAVVTLRSLGQQADESVAEDPATPLARVVGVSLDWGNVKEADLRDLSRYPNLEDLYLSTAKLTEEQYAAIGTLRSLKKLFLSGSNVTDADLKRLSGLANLSYLSLADTRVSDTGLSELTNFRRLRRVDLGQDVTERGVAKLRRLRPNLLARPEPLAFLAPLRPRRIEMWNEEARGYTMVQMPRFPDAGISVHYLVFPKETSGQVDDLLRKELTRQDWKVGHSPILMTGGYYRDLTTNTGSSTNRQIDIVYLNANAYGPPERYGNFAAEPGERLIVVWTIVPG